MRIFLDSVINRFGLVILLALVWLGFSPEITYREILLGIFFGVVIKKLTDYLFRDLHDFDVSVLFILCFLIYLKNVLVNIFKSSFQMVPIILQHTDNPIIFNVHLTTRDPLVVTLVANAITLTPGTITLEASEDGVLSVLSVSDDGQNGRIWASEILEKYNNPFNPAIHRKGDDSWTS